MLASLLPRFFLFVISFSAIATSTMAGIKIAEGFKNSSPQVAGISIESFADTPEPSPNSTPTDKPKSKPASTFPLSATIVPAKGLPSPTSTPSKTVTCNPPANLCVITLMGQQYDVTRLRNSHSGGDIFVCNTDMSARYQSQHGSSLSRMQAYLYQPGNCDQSQTGNTGNTPAKDSDFRKIEDEEDDSENELEKKEDEHEDNEVDE